MRFIRKIIGPDEKLIGICSIHWIYGARGLLWLAGFLALGKWFDTIVLETAGAYMSAQMFGFLSTLTDVVFWICAALGFFIFMPYFLMMVATEVGLTNKRIIFKKGLFLVEVKEVDLEEIKACEVNNGVFGRLLNYGYLIFDARFIENVNLPAIADPYRFVKALNEARSNLRQDSMTVILEGQAEAQAVAVPPPAVPSEKKTHKLAEQRYGGVETKPSKAAEGMMREAIANVEPPHAKNVAPLQAPVQKFPAAPQQAPKVSDVKNKTGQGPIVFQKEILKDVVKDNFTETSST